MNGDRLLELKIGQQAEFAKTISEHDIYAFAGITGDFNPLHVNEEEAKKSIFKHRVAHGILGVGLISAVIANKLPGKGSIYLSQNTKFIAPIFIGDTITAVVEIIDIHYEKRKITLRTDCFNQEGKKVIQGEAMVLLP